MKTSPDRPRRVRELPRRRRRGFNFIELTFAAFFLALLSISIWNFLGGATRSVQRTDARREARFLMKQVLDQVEAADFLVLYQNFGKTPPTENSGLKNSNPLNVEDSVIERLKELKWYVQVKFRFMTRSEVGSDVAPSTGPSSVDPEAVDIEASSRGNRLRPTTSGILPFQGAVVELAMMPQSDAKIRLPPLTIKKPVYCPLIIGRPGLTLAQCPALNVALQDDPALAGACP